MNWQAVSAVAAGCIALAGLANYLMLNEIKVAILRQTDELKDWARAEFAAQRETERRLGDLERRVEHHWGSPTIGS